MKREKDVFEILAEVPEELVIDEEDKKKLFELYEASETDDAKLVVIELIYRFGFIQGREATKKGLARKQTESAN